MGIETNPYQSPVPEPTQIEPPVRAGGSIGLPPRMAYWMALFASAGTAVCTLGGVAVAAEHNWDLLATCLVPVYAVTSIWSGRLAMRIKREELRRKNYSQ